MNRFGRYLRTAATLSPGQVAARVLHEGRMRAYRAAPGLLGSPWMPDAGARAAAVSIGLPPRDLMAREALVAARWARGEVAYHGKARPRDDWKAPGMTRLWRYERQYHSEIVPLAAMAAAEPGAGWEGEARVLVDSWARACPPVTPDAWEPYPVARRILNWSLAMAILPSLREPLAPRLSAQLRFLSGHLEHHLRGNHLICDAAALLTGGALLEGGDEWRAKGESLLVRELGRQVLPDGGYAERTAQYHVIVLQDVAVAAALARASGHPVGPGVTAPAAAMASWLSRILRTDGSIPCLNDAAPDATPDVRNVLSLAAALGLGRGPWDGWLGRCFGRVCSDGTAPAARDLDLPDTGWSIVREGAHELLFEHGPIGPRDQPGHGHSDALSYELIWDGSPVVLDTGVTTYQAGPVRDFERSTRAHASASVEGSPPDELWEAFRVGARSRVAGGAGGPLPAGGRVRRGEVRATGGWVHRRSIACWPGRAVVVFDSVKGTRGRPVTLSVPLARGLSVVKTRVEGHPAAIELHVAKGSARPGEGWIGAGFEQRVPRVVVEIEPAADGRACHALLGPGSSLAVDGGSCTIVMPGGPVRLALDPDGLPS